MRIVLSLSRRICVSANKDDVVASTASVFLNTAWLVLQILLILKVIKDTVGSYTLNELVEVELFATINVSVHLDLALLHLRQLLIRHGLA